MPSSPRSPVHAAQGDLELPAASALRGTAQSQTCDMPYESVSMFGFPKIGNYFILYETERYKLILGPDYYGGSILSELYTPRLTVYLGVAFTILVLTLVTILLNSSVVASDQLPSSEFQILIGIAYVSSLITFLAVALKDPGILRRSNLSQVPGDENEMPYCDICSIFQPPRTAHCATCDCCIDGLDHHCPWIGKCVGRKNMFFFKVFNFCWVFYFFLFLFIMFKS
jgi:hypothetical protein